MLDAYRISENVDGQTFFEVFRMMESEMSLYNRETQDPHTPSVLFIILPFNKFKSYILKYKKGPAAFWGSS
jgi:hypothetical protein